MEEVLKKEYYGNNVEHYLITLGIILGGLLLLRLFRKSILSKLQKWASGTETKFDDYIVGGIQKFGLPILNFVVIYFGWHYVNHQCRTLGNWLAFHL
jgi:hypothetical protein